MRERKKVIVISGVIILLASILIPFINLLLWAFAERWSWPSLFPETYSARGFLEMLGRMEELLHICCSSIMISVAVSILSVVISLMTSRAIVLYDFKGKGILYFSTILPFLIPGTVFAMGIHVVFIRLGFSDTITGVILVHLIFSLPYGIRLLIDGTEAIGSGLEEQARVLGAKGWQAFWKVTVPVLSPVILSALSMSYVVSFSQYFLTLMIGGGKVKTFAVVMVPYLQNGDRNIASAYSLVFLGITLLVFGIFEWLIGRWNKNMNGAFYGTGS